MKHLQIKQQDYLSVVLNTIKPRIKVNIESYSGISKNAALGW